MSTEKQEQLHEGKTENDQQQEPEPAHPVQIERKSFPWQCSNCLGTTMQFATTLDGYANYVHCPLCKGKGTRHYDRKGLA